MVVKFRNILIAAVMVCTVTTLLHADLWALQTDGVLPTMTPQPTPSPTPTITEVPPDASRPPAPQCGAWSALPSRQQASS